MLTELGKNLLEQRQLELRSISQAMGLREPKQVFLRPVDELGRPPSCAILEGKRIVYIAPEWLLRKDDISPVLLDERISSEKWIDILSAHINTNILGYQASSRYSYRLLMQQELYKMEMQDSVFHFLAGHELAHFYFNDHEWSMCLKVASHVGQILLLGSLCFFCLSQPCIVAISFIYTLGIIILISPEKAGQNLSIFQEFRADKKICELAGLINAAKIYFRLSQNSNKHYGSIYNSRVIDQEGNYLDDFTHPSLSDRIKSL